VIDLVNATSTPSPTKREIDREQAGVVAGGREVAATAVRTCRFAASVPRRLGEIDPVDTRH
jgi:hypothetical protein